MTSFLEEELCCAVCSDFFKDPVLLKCSHSFCRVCLKKFWEQKSSRECPLCRRKSMDDPPLNLILKNIVENHLKHKNEAPEKTEAPEKNESHCSLHGEKLLLYCVEDQEPICVVCQTARKHRDHQLCPLEEAVEDKKVISSVLLIFPRGCYINLIFQSQHTEKKIKGEFEELHQFLREEEEARLTVLRVEEKEKSFNYPSQQVFWTEWSHRCRRLTSDPTASLTPACRCLCRAQCSLQDPELASGALIDVAKHLGSLKFRVWEKMLGTVQYTPVTLDPNTAAPWLSVSDDLTSVRYTGVYRQLPDNPERFTNFAFLLGSEGFNSGKHSWEVEVGDKPEWDVGVAAESVNRKGGIAYWPEDGLQVMTLRKGDEYEACTSTPTHLRLKRKPQRIRVQLDYDRGEVSFFNPTDMSLIYTFKGTFTGRLFPFFSPCVNDDGSNPGPLKICPKAEFCGIYLTSFVSQYSSLIPVPLPFKLHAILIPSSVTGSLSSYLPCILNSVHEWPQA
uniref:Tripartite motif containing 35-12 n=1 Tax=Paramormyrops kingsleyae TaxID=1676925 RepID=A0A3B3S9Z0_9TELE